jgi:hypothetical protein
MLAHQRLRREAPVPERAAREVLDQHVEVREEAAEERTTLVGAHVERDALLVPVEGEERDGDALRGRVPRPPLVAEPRRLHLHHLRAVVREDGRAERAREEARQVEDTDAGERAHRQGTKVRSAESSASMSA